MKKFTTSTLLLFVLLTFVKGQPLELYVSESIGNDQNTGSISQPFKTIDKAKMEARLHPNNPVNINISPGKYVLDHPLIFNHLDNRSSSAKLVFRKLNSVSGEVIISGGRKLPNNWQSTSNPNVWCINLSSIVPNNFIFRQLWVNSVKAPRAFELINQISYSRYSINIAQGSKIANVPTAPYNYRADLEVWAKRTWQCSLLMVDNATNQVITVNQESAMWLFGEDTDQLNRVIRVENAKEFIDEPGEWFYDRTTKVLYHYPYDVTSLNSSEFIIPLLEKIAVATDVSNINFQQITFSHATWTSHVSQYGYRAQQGSLYVNNSVHPTTEAEANLEFTNSNNIHFIECAFKHLGGEALCFQNRSTGNLVDNCDFSDIAGTAIRIGNGPRYTITDINITSNHNRITNSIISNVANEFWSHCGIWIGFCSNNTVTGNTISNVPYTAISLGYPYTPSNPVLNLGNNYVANNKIFNVMTELVDGAAIYNQAPNFGQTIIENNLICDISGPPTRAGIYLDQGSSNILIQNNYGYVSTGSAIKMHLVNLNEHNNVLINNNFVDCPLSDHWLYTPKYAPPYHTFGEGNGNLQVKFVDVNHDGLKDMLYYRWLSSNSEQVGVYLNNCGIGWIQAPENYHLPYHLYADGVGKLGAQFIDFDGDGFEDLIYSRLLSNGSLQSGAYKNTGTGWVAINTYIPPIPMYADIHGELGVKFIDINQDGLKDLIYSRWLTASIQHRRIYLNTGIGWQQTTDPQYSIPHNIMFSADGIGDLGVKIVDINADGKEDMVFWRWGYEKGCYLQNPNGSGWIQEDEFTPPYPLFDNKIGDLGVKFIDINHDGYIDMCVNRIVNQNQWDKRAWNNTGSTWQSIDPSYTPPIPTCIDFNHGEQGVEIVDLNGDGFSDVVQGYWRTNKYHNIYDPFNTRSRFTVDNMVSQSFLNNSTVFNCEANTSISASRASSKSLKYIALNSDNAKARIKVYPNPCINGSSVNIEFSESKSDSTVKILIYTMTGTNIYTETIRISNNVKHSIDIPASVSKGLYFMVIEGYNLNFIEKFVIL